MIILGIDPGIARVGFAILESKKSEIKALSYGLISTDKDTPKAQRLNQIYEDTKEIIDKWQPDVVVLETLIFAKNTKTAMTVSEARGVLLLVAEQMGKTILEITPLEVKKLVCGYGRASKSQVQSAVKMLLALPEIPTPDDVADALAIALSQT